VRRGGRLVLPHIDADVEAGHVTGLLGPSGSDKTTLARVLELVSGALPLTCAYDALARVTTGAPLGGRFALDLTVTLGATLLALALGALTLRRRTP